MFDKKFESSEYLSLSTRKKDGTTVETPVWFAFEGDTIYLFSEGNAGKVKRLRNFPQSRIATCDVRGKLKSEWFATEGRIISEEKEVRTAHAALTEKYKWKMKSIDFLSRMAGKINKRDFIAIKAAS